MSDSSPEVPGEEGSIEFDRRIGIARGALIVVAALTAAALLAPKLSALTTQTRRFVELELRDSGPFRPPLPEALVVSARRELGTGETWSLETPNGTCSRHEQFFWLTFRLMPNMADCATPDVAIYAGVSPPAGAKVVRTGRSFVLVRP